MTRLYNLSGSLYQVQQVEEMFQAKSKRKKPNPYHKKARDALQTRRTCVNIVLKSEICNFIAKRKASSQNIATRHLYLAEKGWGSGLEYLERKFLPNY